MQNLHAMNDWGIYVSHEEVLNGTLDRAKLEEAGFQLIHPIAGCVYMDDYGEYFESNKPFWFLPIQQPALFDSFYESIEDVKAEVEPLYPEAFKPISVAERLCRANVVWAT